MSDEYDFDAPDHCTVGVVGEVGQRLFLFYCRQGLSEPTVKVEKQQVAVLAGYLGRIVKELGRPGHLPDDLQFYGTEEYEWVVGTIGVSYDEELDRVIVVLEEVGVEEVRERPDVVQARGHGALCDRNQPPTILPISRSSAATGARRSRSVTQAARTAAPLRSAPLEAAVAEVLGTLSVVVFITRTMPSGRPSSRIATPRIFV